VFLSNLFCLILTYLGYDRDKVPFQTQEEMYDTKIYPMMIRSEREVTHFFPSNQRIPPPVLRETRK
jgi:hypothetical protein